MSQHVLVSGILMLRLNGFSAKHPFRDDKSLYFFSTEAKNCSIH